MPTTTGDRTRVAVMISGAGSNMAALIDAGQTPDSPYQVVLVVSNKPDAGGLHIAEAKGVRAVAVDHRDFPKDREAHERAIDALLAEADVQIIALAGYMRVLTPYLVQRWEGRMINVHPSLLPLYPGLDTHARAIAAGDAEGGCTVHIVTDGVDEGPVLGQARVPILRGDTPDALAERVHVAEHQLYPRVLTELCRSLH
ncbi:MAG TPA: phosphoribosylglycinamide formyltransferase [Brevundimonas sp.]